MFLLAALLGGLRKQSDEFVPRDGALHPLGVGAKTEEEFPGTHVALHVLEFGLKEMAAEGACRAVGVALDSRLKSGDSKDAVWITLEEIGGKSQGLIVPYAKSAIGDVTFGDATAMLGSPRIFVVDKATKQ